MSRLKSWSSPPPPLQKGREETMEVELLGLTIDYNLKFNAHIDQLYTTARFELHALCRIIKFLIIEQAILANSFVNTQFGYAPLT